MKFEVYTKLSNGAIIMEAEKMFEECSYTCFKRDNITVKYPTDSIVQINQTDDAKPKFGNREICVEGKLFRIVNSIDHYEDVKFYTTYTYESCQEFDYATAKSLGEKISSVYKSNPHLKNICIKGSYISTAHTVKFNYDD